MAAVQAEVCVCDLNGVTDRQTLKVVTLQAQPLSIRSRICRFQAHRGSGAIA